jgi:hypothetical protein
MVNVNVIVIKTFISKKNSFQKYDKTVCKNYAIQGMTVENNGIHKLNCY